MVFTLVGEDKLEFRKGSDFGYRYDMSPFQGYSLYANPTTSPERAGYPKQWSQAVAQKENP